jgi:hypothetical protein
LQHQLPDFTHATAQILLGISGKISGQNEESDIGLQQTNPKSGE